MEIFQVKEFYKNKMRKMQKPKLVQVYMMIMTRKFKTKMIKLIN